MKKTGKLFLQMVVVLLLATSYAHAQPNLKQKKDQLQSQMKKLQDEIKTIEAAIQKTSARKEKSLGEILALQAKIRSREKLIRNMNDQIEGLDETIDSTRAQIAGDSIEIEKKKREYARVLVKSYQNIALQNQLSFILSAESFSEAFRRYNYLQKIAQYRREQAIALQQSIAALQHKKDDLQDTKSEKLNLLERQTSQKEDLEREKKEKDAAVAKLQEKEQKLRKQIDEKNKTARQLNSKIQAIIEEEIKLAKKKAEENAKRNPTANPPVKKDAVMPLTPAEQALSADFVNNKGKLPWPVLRGHITSQFGKHEHAILKNVMVENNGVDIQSEKGSEARAVFGGTVVSIFAMPTIQNCIIIKHGEYFTVYSNIETVTVKTNQTITTKQTLGKLHTEKGEEFSKVHLEIWKGKEKMDPEIWLAN